MQTFYIFLILDQKDYYYYFDLNSVTRQTFSPTLVQCWPYTEFEHFKKWAQNSMQSVQYTVICMYKLRDTYNRRFFSLIDLVL